MTESLITYKTAKLAKEKGFDIPVRYGIYGKEMKLTQNMGWERNPKLELVNWNSKTKQQKHSQATSVPTQSLLQKWLREEHNLEILVFYSQTAQYSIRIGNIIKMKEGLPPVMYSELAISGTYEEALERGLQEGLKLI
jgi:hypothetical protein